MVRRVIRPLVIAVALLITACAGPRSRMCQKGCYDLGPVSGAVVPDDFIMDESGTVVHADGRIIGETGVEIAGELLRVYNNRGKLPDKILITVMVLYDHHELAALPENIDIILDGRVIQKFIEERQGEIDLEKKLQAFVEEMLIRIAARDLKKRGIIV